jgi:hypothetical protein
MFPEWSLAFRLSDELRFYSLPCAIGLNIPPTSSSLSFVLSVLENRLDDKEFLDVNINVV